MNIVTAAIGTLLVAAAPTWGLLYHTGLETPDYTAGKALHGQAGWVGLDTSFNAPQVVEGAHMARSGRRAIKCWGGDLTLPWGPGLYDCNFEKPIIFDAVTNPAEVRVQADVRLDGPDTGDGPGADLLSANLMARNGTHQSAFFYLSSNGNAYANAFSDGGDNWYKFETPIKLGVYNRLAIILNYRNHMATFEVNGKTIGSLPFGGKGERFKSALLEMAAWEDPSFNHKLYNAYWDNVVVRAKPAH